MIRAKCWLPAHGAWADRYKAESWLCTGGEGGLFDALTHWIRPLRMWFGEIEKVGCNPNPNPYPNPNPNPNPILTLTQVMSYDLSDDQDFHECPTDQACTNPNTNP